jgi:FlaG/FlaF family flagellin (archaellin)
MVTVMTWFSNLLPYGLATAGIILASTIATKTTGTSPAISQTSPPTTTQTTTNTTSPEPNTSPRRLTVTVNVGGNRRFVQRSAASKNL